MTSHKQEDTAMADDTATTEITETTTDPDAAEQTTEQAETGDDERTEQTPSREAARWRKKLREAEAERDNLAERVQAYEQADIVRAATTGDGPRLHDGDDLFRYGTVAADVLDDHGAVDTDKLWGAIEEITAQRPHLRADLAPRPPRASRSQGRASQGDGGRRSAGEGWQTLLRGPR